MMIGFKTGTFRLIAYLGIISGPLLVSATFGHAAAISQETKDDCVSAGGKVVGPGPAHAIHKKSPRLKQEVPKGVTIQGNKVTLKKGYQFKRLSQNEVAIQDTRTAAKPITGTFTCQCDMKGSCTLQTTPNSLICFKDQGDTCSSNCVMFSTTKPVKEFMFKN